MNIRWLVALGVTATLLFGCGSDDDSTSTTTTEDPAGDTTTTDADGSTTSGSIIETGEAGCDRAEIAEALPEDAMLEEVLACDGGWAAVRYNIPPTDAIYEEPLEAEGQFWVLTECSNPDIPAEIEVLVC